MLHLAMIVSDVTRWEDLQSALGNGRQSAR